MLTDYERYQLEWMIDHGHSLKEFVRSIDSVFDSLSDKYDSDIMDSIDNLPDTYEIRRRDILQRARVQRGGPTRHEHRDGR